MMLDNHVVSNALALESLLARIRRSLYLESPTPRVGIAGIFFSGWPWSVAVAALLVVQAASRRAGG
jgi:hypothetical protein